MRYTSVYTTLRLLSIFLLLSAKSFAQNYPAIFDPSQLSGKNGFSVPGIIDGSRVGAEVDFIGDINNDGIEDLALGAEYAEPNGLHLGGTVYVIFGSTDPFPAIFDLNSLDGTNGFRVEGIVEDERRGYSNAGLGDINGDGIDDMIIGGNDAKSVVLYGRSGAFPAVMNVNDINGSNGFIINQSGITEVNSAGDVNGDGINDILLAYPHWAGETLIIFGKTENFPATIDRTWLDGIKGFRISDFPGGRPAYLANGAGDINNDGYDDILVGNWSSEWDENGEISYAILGRATFDAYVDAEAVDGTDGFRIHNEGNGFLTFVGPLGDINGDGIDDFFSENNVIFGSSTPFPASIAMSDLNGTNGFLLDKAVLAAAPAGDLNFDGLEDFIVAGASEYVVYGSNTGFPSLVSSDDLDGSNGFVIPNLIQSNIGRTVAGRGDFNGDGLMDFILGSEGTGPGGTAYIVFGGDHIAFLNDDYPKANNFTSMGFTLQANAPETGLVHYAFFPSYYWREPTHSVISNGTDAIQNGSFAIENTNTDVNEVITGLTSGQTYDVYLFFEDERGNKSVIYFFDDLTTLEELDTEAPEGTCPAHVEVTCNTTTIPDFLHLITVRDNEDPNPSLTQSPEAGSPFIPGMTITVTAKDASGNTSSCEFQVDAADIEAPTINCPGTQSLAFGATLPDYTSLASTSDNCDMAPTITQWPAAGTLFTAETTVRLTVKDASGNTRSCSFQVRRLADTEAPAIVCPGNQEITCNTSTIPDFRPLVTTSDNQDANPTLTQSPVVGSPFTPGMTITITAEDAAGNSSNCSFRVNVIDLEAPVINCPGTQVLALGATLPDYTTLATFSDNCDTELTITQFPAPGTLFTEEMTIRLTVKDASGFEETCSFQAKKIADTEAPVITCPGNQELACGTTVLPDFTSLILVSDNQDAAPSIVQSPAPGTAISNSMTVSITAKDQAGNTSSCSINVEANPLPRINAGQDVVLALGNSHQLNALSESDGTYSWSPATGLDDAGIPNPIASPGSTTTYTVRITTDGNCTAEDQVTIFVEKIAIAKGISPDNDGINDTWTIGGIENYPDNQVVLYNRWGDLVYAESGYNNSDRIFKGSANRLSKLGAGDLPEGTYFYVIKLGDGEDPLKGYLVLKK